MTLEVASGILLAAVLGALVGAAAMDVVVRAGRWRGRAAKAGAWPEHTYFASLPMARCGCGVDVPIYRVDAKGWRFARHSGLGAPRCRNSDELAAGRTDQSRDCRCCIEGFDGTCTPLWEPSSRFDIEGWVYLRPEERT